MYAWISELRQRVPLPSLTGLGNVPFLHFDQTVDLPIDNISATCLTVKRRSDNNFVAVITVSKVNWEQCELI
jgi:hypothetical protein